MNFLIISQFLLSKNENLLSRGILSEIKKIHSDWRFDAIILLSDGTNDDDEKFSFAKVHKKAIEKNTSLAEFANSMMELMGQLSSKMCEKCSFSILYSNEKIPSLFCREPYCGRGVCFMRLREPRRMPEFTSVSLEVDQEEFRRCLMQRLEAYEPD
jgi:hypothetical protein